MPKFIQRNLRTLTMGSDGERRYWKRFLVITASKKHVMDFIAIQAWDF